ncbi:MAG: hypothetical protein HY554_09725 [Elusimicrobia bacterium]|nr:hypothetical protein [Elusimicrobiota bacterium]
MGLAGILLLSAAVARAGPGRAIVPGSELEPSLPAAADATIRPAGEPVVVREPVSAALQNRLELAGTAEERALLRALLVRLAAAPGLRGLAERLNAAPGKLTVRFAEFPGTTLYERRTGRWSFDARVAAHFVRAEGEAVIELNRACLRIDPEFALRTCAVQLAHELLGHALAWLEAAEAGLASAYLHFDDEALAKLAGWTAAAELDGRIPDPEAWCAVSQPEAFRKGLKRTYPYSAGALSRDELADPVGTLRARRGAAESALARGYIDSALRAFEGGAGEDLRAACRAAAAHPLLDALERRSAALRLRLLEAPERLFRFGSCSEYY